MLYKLYLIRFYDKKWNLVKTIREEFLSKKEAKKYFEKNMDLTDLKIVIDRDE